MKYFYLLILLIFVGIAKYNSLQSNNIEISNKEENSSIVSNTNNSIVKNTKNTKNTNKINLKIIPGDRVGDITTNTDRDELTKLFPANIAKLEDIEVHLGEGFTTEGTQVEISGENKLTIVWKNKEKNQIEKVVDFGSAWYLPEDIHVDMEWESLLAKLGEFELFGFRWDYGGTLQLEGTPLEKYQDYLIIRVTPSEEAISSNVEALNAVSGERLIESKNPNLQQLDLKVSEIIVIFK